MSTKARKAKKVKANTRARSMSRAGGTIKENAERNRKKAQNAERKPAISSLPGKGMLKG